MYFYTFVLLFLVFLLVWIIMIFVFLSSGIQHALCRPGPDLVVCDEGHRIKNDATNLSQALKKLRTRFGKHCSAHSLEMQSFILGPLNNSCLKPLEYTIFIFCVCISPPLTSALAAILNETQNSDNVYINFMELTLIYIAIEPQDFIADFQVRERTG